MTVVEIENAIEKLPPEDFSKLSEWFSEYESQIWDEKIKRNLQNGNLKVLIEEAGKDFAEGNCRPL